MCVHAYMYVSALAAIIDVNEVECNSLSVVHTFWTPRARNHPVSEFLNGITPDTCMFLRILE